MGGSAFASLGYDTPRMPNEVYQQLKSSCIKSLEDTYFDIVNAPASAPGKESHGDLDLLALPKLEFLAWLNAEDESGPKGSEQKLKELMTCVEWEAVATALGAVAFIVNQPTVMFAVPLTDSWTEITKSSFPQESESDKRESTTNISLLENQRFVSTISPKCPYKVLQQVQPGRVYAQVDVHLAESSEQLEWLTFTHAHGDKLMILNILQRPLGLVAKDDGLWVRLKEIQDAGETKKGCHVFVTRDIQRVVKFWDLRQPDGHSVQDNGIVSGFETEENLFRHLISSPLFGPTICHSLVVDRYLSTDQTNNPPTPTPAIPVDDKPAATATRSDQPGPSDETIIRAKDRKHVRKRAMFGRFIEDFLPANADVLLSREDHTRELVLEKLLEGFADTGLVERVEAAREAFRRRREMFGMGKKNKAKRKVEDD